jgi:hypothetical protein
VSDEDEKSKLLALLKETLPHLEYKRTHTQTSTGMKNVARLIQSIKLAIKEE